MAQNWRSYITAVNPQDPDICWGCTCQQSHVCLHKPLVTLHHNRCLVSFVPTKAMSTALHNMALHKGGSLHACLTVYSTVHPLHILDLKLIVLLECLFNVI